MADPQTLIVDAAVPASSSASVEPTCARSGSAVSTSDEAVDGVIAYDRRRLKSSLRSVVTKTRLKRFSTT